MSESTEPLQIFTTGGTIDKVYFDALSDYQVGHPLAEEVLRQAHVAFLFSVTSLMKKDSIDMDDTDRAAVRAAVERCAAKRVLITHGTDTMAETARVLKGIPDKTVIFTGSLTPARFQESDAFFNIGFAVAAARILPPGVYVAMQGRVFDAARVRKDRARNRFEAVE